MASLPDGLLSLYYRLKPARTIAETEARFRRRRKRAAKRALRAALASSCPPASLTEQRLKDLWQEAESHDSTLNSREAVLFMSRSGLPRPVLARIWNISHSASEPGALNFEEFVTAMRLIGIAQFNVALLDSAVTVGRAVSGSISLSPRFSASASPRGVTQSTESSWAIPLTTPPAAPLHDLSNAAPPSFEGGDERVSEEGVSPLQAILAREEHVQRASFDGHEIPDAQLAALDINIEPSSYSPPLLRRLSPPPSISAPRGGFAAALHAHGYVASPRNEPQNATETSQQSSRPVDTGPAQARPSWWAHEEHRSEWADGRQLTGGLRGLVFALPNGNNACEVRGAAIAVADIRVCPGGHVQLAPADEATLQDGSLTEADLWRRTKATVEDTGRASNLIRSTNPFRMRVHAPAAPRSQPLAVLRYIIGAHFSPSPLMALLKRRTVVAPFKTAAELAVVLRCGSQLPLQNVRVTLHAGDAIGEGALAVMKTSSSGQWHAEAEAFTWTLDVVHPGRTVTLRVQLSSDLGGAARMDRPPPYAIITAALSSGTLTSGLVIGGLQPGTGATSSTHVYARVYMTASDAARHTTSRAADGASHIHEAPGSTSRAQHMLAFSSANEGLREGPGAEALSSSDDADSSPRSTTSVGVSDGALDGGGMVAPTSTAPMRVVALFDFSAETEHELSFRAGDALDVTSAAHEGWYDARARDGRKGLVPASYVGLV